MYFFGKFLLFINSFYTFFNILQLFCASFAQIFNFMCTFSTNNLSTYFTGVSTPISFTIARCWYSCFFYNSQFGNSCVLPKYYQVVDDYNLCFWVFSFLLVQVLWPAEIEIAFWIILPQYTLCIGSMRLLPLNLKY